MGATDKVDGESAIHSHMTNTLNTPVEALEYSYPFLVTEYSIRSGTGGRGRHCGGDGIVRRLEFLRPLKVSMLSQRRGPYPPFGLRDGQPGHLGRNVLRRAGSVEDVDLGGCFAIEVAPGDVLTIETPGGGGFGKPES